MENTMRNEMNHHGWALFKNNGIGSNVKTSLSKKIK